MHTIDVAGLKVDACGKQELIETISKRLDSNQRTFITTLYSEFLLAAMRDRDVLNMLNTANLAVADGIGIMWAAKFLQLPLSVKNYYGKILQAFWQAVYSGAGILLRPSWLRSILPEKIVGADLIWDLAELAANHHKTIYLLGGFNDTPKLVADKLMNRSKMSGRSKTSPLNFSIQWSNKNPNDQSVIEDINRAKPDFLFVAYGPIKQERWIAEHLNQLQSVKLAIGLGGTFDYIAGAHKNPPQWIRSIGLEWLYRLFTQPRRFKRIWNATVGLITALIRHKVFMSMPFRKNVVSAILNDRQEILIIRRNPDFPNLKDTGNTDRNKFANYWELPKGGIDGDETVEEAARREVWEELGIQDKDLQYVKISDQHHAYIWNNAARPLWHNGYHHKGQEQTVIYFKFTGDPRHITVDLFENAEYKWIPLKKLSHSIHRERLLIAEIIQADLLEQNA